MSKLNNGHGALPSVSGLPACAGCLRCITTSRYLRCSKCFQYWDPECANADASYMTAELMSTWTCPECVCKKRKGDNADTPVRSSPSFNNVNVLRDTGRNRSSGLDDSVMSLDMSQVLGEDATRVRDTSRVAEKLPAAADGTARVLGEIRSFREETRDELRASREEQRANREELRANRALIEALTDSVQRLTARLDASEGRVGALEGRVAALELAAARDADAAEARLAALDRRLAAAEERPADAGDAARLERTVAELRSELADRDREALLADVEIGQLPEAKGENVLHSVLALAGRCGVPLDERDVVFAERVGAPPPEGGRARRVVVRLARRHVRDELLRAARARRSLAHEGGARVYINERLTRANRQLFHLAREGCRRLQWRYAWTRRGLVFVRKADGAQVHQLRAPEDAVRLFGAPPSGS